MLTYTRLADAAKNGLIDLTRPSDLDEVTAYLCDQWIDDYSRTTARSDIVEVKDAGFKYLFDIPSGRLLAAYGISRGRAAHARDTSRMAGHPLGGGSAYHRGHAIAHRLGGGTDINLVAQRGSINIGPFRQLEREAIATPGSLYFSYWMYRRGPDQKPMASQQGLLKPDALTLRNHGN